MHPNGYVELGQAWHSKMVLRAELTGVPINGYNTGIDDHRKPLSALEVDYWFGGLVALGTAPQPEGGGVPGPFDVQIGRWLRRYNKYGHHQPHLIQTLRFDADCCQ